MGDDGRGTSDTDRVKTRTKQRRGAKEREWNQALAPLSELTTA